MDELDPEDGLSWADISASENRIVVAVVPESLDDFRAMLPDLLRQTGIDSDAVVTVPGRRAVFDVGSPAAERADDAASEKTLGNLQRPLQGGYGIQWSDGPCSPAGA